MTSPPHGWVRAERLDAARMLDALHAETGVRLVLDGPCPGGQVGAAYVRRADRRNRLQAGRLAGHPDVPAPPRLFLRQDGPGYGASRAPSPGTGRTPGSR
ncbi:hypothetical protein ACWDF9_28895 [Streptomyces rubiginosohelvolus]